MKSFFKTRDDAIAHWNLIPIGDGKYQHATKTGHIFTEDDLNHMQKYGVMKDPSISSEEYESKYQQLRKKIKESVDKSILLSSLN